MPLFAPGGGFCSWKGCFGVADIFNPVPARFKAAVVDDPRVGGVPNPPIAGEAPKVDENKLPDPPIPPVCGVPKPWKNKTINDKMSVKHKNLGTGNGHLKSNLWLKLSKTTNNKMRVRGEENLWLKLPKLECPTFQNINSTITLPENTNFIF